MSGFNVIALAIAALIATTAVGLWVQGKAAIAAREVHTGVVHGFPVSNRTRRLWLYQMFVPYQMSNFVLNLTVGFAIYSVAQTATSKEAVNVALLVAFFLFLGSFWVVGASLVTVAGLSKSIRLNRRSSTDGHRSAPSSTPE